MTNADKIRSLDDVELALYIDQHASDAQWCEATGPCQLDTPCVQCIVRWLMKEAEP